MVRSQFPYTEFLGETRCLGWNPVVTEQVAKVRHGSMRFRHRVSWRNSVLLAGSRLSRGRWPGSGMVRRNSDTAVSWRNSVSRWIPGCHVAGGQGPAWFVAIQTPSFLEKLGALSWSPVVTWQVAKVRMVRRNLDTEFLGETRCLGSIPVVTRTGGQGPAWFVAFPRHRVSSPRTRCSRWVPGCHVAGGQGPAWFVALQTPSFLEKLGVSLIPVVTWQVARSGMVCRNSDTEFLGETRCLAEFRLCRTGGQGPAWLSNSDTEFLQELGVSLDPGCHVAGGQGPAWFVAIQTPSFSGETRCLS